MTCITKPGRTFGILPKLCTSTAQPQSGFREAVTIGPCKEIELKDGGTSVEHRYRDDEDASITGPLFQWILDNAKHPIAIGLHDGFKIKVSRTGSHKAARFFLHVAFSDVADEQAYLAFAGGAA